MKLALKDKRAVIKSIHSAKLLAGSRLEIWHNERNRNREFCKEPVNTQKVASVSISVLEKYEEMCGLKTGEETNKVA